MRRKAQQLPQEEAIEILKTRTHGILATSGDDDYPYAVPLSYLYEDGKIWFHCAMEGHKLDAIRQNPKVSFCVVAEDHVVPEKLTTFYKSVIAFGKARILEGEEKRRSVVSLARRYAPEASQESIDREIDDSWPRLCMVEIAIEHLTGKECMELTKKRKSEK